MMIDELPNSHRFDFTWDWVNRFGVGQSRNALHAALYIYRPLGIESGSLRRERKFGSNIGVPETRAFS